LYLCGVILIEKYVKKTEKTYSDAILVLKNSTLLNSPRMSNACGKRAY